MLKENFSQFLTDLVDRDHHSNTKTYNPWSFCKEWKLILNQVEEHQADVVENLDVGDLIIETDEDVC